MKKLCIILLTFCLLLCSCNSSQKKETSKTDNYELKFEENFEGNSINSDKWSFEQGLIRNNEPQYYTDRQENASVKDGKLIINCQAEDYTGSDGKTAKYTSSSLHTRDKYSFTYGKIEMRAKLPSIDCKAAWPAFWMMGNDVMSNGWPKCGEVDILEMYGVNNKKYETNIHWSDKTASTGYEGYVNMMQYPYNKKISKSLNEPLGNNWHIYGLIWTKEKMEFTFDNHSIGSFNITEDSMTELHNPMYLIVNLALTQEGDTTPLDNGENLQYIIDYIKVYQHK